MNLRPSILLVPAILLAACAPVSTGDDAAVAQALGAVQPALEAQSALLVAVDACEGCDTLQELAGFLATELAACATVRPVDAAESACTRLDGRPAAEVQLSGCILGFGRPISGTLLVTQAEGSAVRHFETDLIAGDHGVVACGEVVGSGRVHSIAFDAVAHGATGGDVLLAWRGPAWREDDGRSLRAGTLEAQFTGTDGVGYLVTGEATGLARAEGDTLPHAGRIAFQGTDGQAAIEFAPETPTTGGLHLLRPDGRRETVVVAR